MQCIIIGIEISRMISIDVIDNYSEKFSKEIFKNYKDLFHDYPIDRYITDVKSYGEFLSYKYFSPQLKTVFEEILTKYATHTFALYQKMALIAFIRDSIDRLRTKNIPESILSLYLTLKWLY